MPRQNKVQDLGFWDIILDNMRTSKMDPHPPTLTNGQDLEHPLDLLSHRWVFAQMVVMMLMEFASSGQFSKILVHKMTIS